MSDISLKNGGFSNVNALVGPSINHFQSLTIQGKTLKIPIIITKSHMHTKVAIVVEKKDLLFFEKSQYCLTSVFDIPINLAVCFSGRARRVVRSEREVLYEVVFLQKTYTRTQEQERKRAQQTL